GVCEIWCDGHGIGTDRVDTSGGTWGPARPCYRDSKGRVHPAASNHCAKPPVRLGPTTSRNSETASCTGGSEATCGTSSSAHATGASSQDPAYTPARYFAAADRNRTEPRWLNAAHFFGDTGGAAGEKQTFVDWNGWVRVSASSSLQRASRSSGRIAADRASDCRSDSDSVSIARGWQSRGRTN